jgi:hypothetical protein
MTTEVFTAILDRERAAFWAHLADPADAAKEAAWKAAETALMEAAKP